MRLMDDYGNERQVDTDADLDLVADLLELFADPEDIQRYLADQRTQRTLEAMEAVRRHHG